ncbi:MAG: hypothetical protein IKC73_01615 [Clostridia bacterium]|nr:hypothetical protein [Clostridia bacterium]
MTAIKKIPWLTAGGLTYVFLFLLFNETVTEAVRNGLLLCARAVIPSLFPFLVLSGILTPLLKTASLPFSKTFSRLFRLPAIGLAPCLIGALCGFPIGVVTVAELYRAGDIEKEEAVRLASLAANTGPAFAVAAIGQGLFGSARLGWQLYFLQLLSSFLLGLLETRGAPRPHSHGNATRAATAVPLPEAIYRASLTMLTVTGTVLFFSALAAIPALLLPPWLSALLSAFLEVGTGTAAAARLPLALGIPIAAFALSFSGLSVLLQSSVALSAANLPQRHLYQRKLCQGLLASLLSIPLLWI